MNKNRYPRRIFGVTFPVFLAFLLLVLLGFVGLQSSSGQEQPAGGDITARMLVAPDALVGLRPTNLQWSPLGSTLAYVDLEDGQEKLWLYETATDTRHVLFDPATSSDNIALSTAQWSPAGDTLLLEGEEALWLLDAETGELSQLAQGGDKTAVAFSPSGEMVSYVQDNNLYALHIAGGDIQQLTTDGSETVRNATVFNGSLDWVYTEEFATRVAQPAYSWSPDGEWLIYLRLDDEGVQEHPFTDYSTIPAAVNMTRYPAAGSPNPQASLHLIQFEDGTAKPPVPLPEDAEYILPFFTWDPGSGEAIYLAENREHSELRVEAWDPQSGTGRTVIQETDPDWINEFLYVAPVFLGEDGQFLWLSERDGFMHIYLYSREGELIRQVTEGEWLVDSLPWDLLTPGKPVHVDPSGTWAYFSSTQVSPLERHLFRVNIATGEMEQISQEAGFHSAALSADGKYLVEQFSSVDITPLILVLNVDGSLAEILGRSAGPSLDLPEVSREFLKIKAHDGEDLYAQIVKPEDFDPQQKYPVIIHWYGGPSLQLVSNRYGTDNVFNHIERDVIYTQEGFIVWRLDNRGSIGRGHAFETPIAGELGPAALDDQIAGVEYLRSLPYVDADRIGVDGKSFGGFLTLYALIHEPDLFAAGVAGSGPTDWRTYDTVYTERYMGAPGQNPDGYEATELVSRVDQLQVRPLIIHGLADTNVHLQNSVNLMDAMMKIDKPFDFLPLPNSDHHYGGDGLAAVLSEGARYFKEHLGSGPVGAPAAPAEAPVGMPNPASVNCTDQGGELETRDEDDGQVGYCIFPDGSECEQWSFFRGECAPGAASYEPLDSEACADVADALSETLTVEFATDQAPFDDYVTGETGTGCQATSVGDGTDFGSLAESAAVLGAALEARGWEVDQQYSADGPTGTAVAYRQENALCLAHISWEPSEDADCPADQPISACELTPEQQLYTATLNCAQPTSSPESPIGMPNPASEYCVEQGGKSEIRDEEDGQVGYCIFEDDSECEEWSFFRGECAPGGQEEAGGQPPVGMPNPASVNCTDQGGELEIRDEDDGQVGYCIFDDGSECEEWAFFNGECEPGNVQESAAPATVAAATAAGLEQYEKGYRFDRNGWIYLHIEGEPHERGYQHGYLLAPELDEIFGNFKDLTYEETGKEWQYFRDQAVEQFSERIDPEYLEEIKGIAAGAQAAGTEITWQDVLTWNGYEELLGYWWPNQMAGRYAQPDKDHCSAFIATGSATKDGKVVMAHNSWDAFAHGQFFNVILNIEPAEGQRMFMQSSPGFIASFTDFFVTGAGIMGTETTMGGYSEYDPDEDPEFFRIRKAMQYADNLDDFVQRMEKKNNGGYANSWLLADANTGEIMRFELGLQYQNVARTKDGYFVGYNAATDPRIRNLESSDTGYDDVRMPSGARRVRLTQLMEEHHGDIDVQLAQEILADHYDVYLEEENPGSRTVEGRYDLDAFEYWPARIPFAPQGAVDGKVMDSDMAQDLSFWGRWGSSSGMPFDVAKHISEHPQWGHLQDYLKDRPTQPWTLFSAGEGQP